MLNIPEAVQNLFKQDGVPKQFRVHFPNGERADIEHDQIVEGSVKFTESVSSKDVLQFGLAEASEIQFECVGVENIYGATIQCATEILVGDADGEDIDDTLSWLTPQYVEYSGKKYYRVPYGEFRVESCTRQHGAMKRRRVQAFGRTALDGVDISNLLYQVMPYSNIQISLNMLNALINNSLFTEQNFSRDFVSNSTSGASLYDSTGNMVGVSVQGSARTICDNYKFSGARNMYAVYAEYETDLDLYEKNGMAVVKALDDAGLSLIYDSKKKKIYSSNEEALRAQCPWLFYPCITEAFNYYREDPRDELGMIQAKYYLSNIPFFLRNSEITLLPEISTLSPLHGTMTNIEYSAALDDGYSQGRQIDIFTPFLNGAIQTSIVVNRYNSDYDVTRTWNLTYTPVEYTFNLNTIKKLTISANSTDPGATTFIQINPTLTIKNKLTFAGYDDGSRKPNLLGKSYPCYTYVNAISIKSTLLGLYELQAEFGKIGRNGELITASLSKSNPIVMQKSEYSDLWWDEYSIDDIGSVRYSFGKDNEQHEYVFGDGLSVYDMTDNDYLKHIAVPDGVEATDYINGLIDTYFVPNITDISFVPVDLEARGLPYLEAGDYIVIDNDDGGTVGTYILNRSISGEMYLEDTIESQGGEIVGSDVRSV